MSVRLRLAFLYSGILALTLIAFGVALHVTLSRVTFNLVEETLADEAYRLIASERFRLDDIHFPAKKVAAPETHVQTLNYQGRVVDRTASLGTFVLPLSESGLRACQKGRSWTEVASTGNGRLLVHSKPIKHDGQVVGILQVGRSLADYDHALDTLQSVLFVVGSVATLLAFACGWMLAGAALRPINRITQTAQAIGTQRDFSQRVEYTGPGDEVGQLAKTFNTMLTELQAAYTQLQQTLQAQRRFVADASHELRTPLTTIRGNIELLRREPPIRAEDRIAVLEDMVDECNRLMRLVNELLVLARADAGRALRSEAVAVKPLLDDLCRQAKLLGPDKEIQCHNLMDAAVLGDRDALKQVLLILLDNALKYTHAGGTIAVEMAADQKQVTIQVQDTGIGIAPELLPQIFERFYRGDSARTGPGAGLGLPIARTLVEAMQGRIEVESQVEHGSVFAVILPRANSETPA